jgi:hypothetical protein
MTRWCTRLVALLGSTMALVYLAAAAASARPIREHVGSTVDGGAQGLPARPVDVVQSGTPLTGWIVATVVLALMAAGVVLVVRTVHAHHAQAV